MIQIAGTGGSPVTYKKLLNNPNWVAFYDDGSVALFGRSDSNAIPADVAYFKANQLDAEAMAFKRPQAVPAWLGAPAPWSSRLIGSFRIDS